MAFTLPESWVWDFWLADNGASYHLFYLHAPKSLGDPHLRHRNARIGHATSTDLVNWTDHGRIFEPGPKGSFDDTANWTGSVVQGPDGRWYLFYTGSRFLSAESYANIETVGLAISDDLFTWVKQPGPVAKAEASLYETLGTSDWVEEAFRDPWVFEGPDGLWHMLVTARANHGESMARGVIGHAVSGNLRDWQLRPALSEIDAGFAHIEVPQLVEIEGTLHLVFCCDASRLSGPLAGRVGGIWSVAVPDALGPYPIARASLLVSQELYAGRIAKDRSGRAVLLAFRNTAGDGGFEGSISDPLPVGIGRHHDGLPFLKLEGTK